MKPTRRIDGARCETLYAELHTLLQAGLDFSNAFALLIASEGDRRTKALLEGLYAAVVRGDTLAQAMERSGAFRALDGGVIRIGERTGRLAEALEFLADYYRKQTEQRRMISAAVSYPIVILAVAAAVVAFMLAVVVPMFEEVYARMGGQLPALTRGIIALSQALPRYAAVAAVVALGGAAAWWRWHRTEAVRERAARLLLGMPLVGVIVRRHHQAHFCKLLHLLAASGIPLLEAVGMLADVIGFQPYRTSFRDICRQLERGKTFAEALARHPALYDRKLVALVRVGEETNRLPEMLGRRARDLTDELRHAIRRLGTLLEPALILLVGIIVATILIAMYLPMFSLGGIIG